MLLFGEHLDRAEHRDREDHGHEDQRYESTPARKVGIPTRDQDRDEERESDEDRRRSRQTQLLVGGQGEEHGRNLPQRRSRWSYLTDSDVVRHTRRVAKNRTSEQEGSGSQIRAHVPAEIRNASFPVAVRGYERRAVDTYIERVNRVIAELEVTRSPQAAVRHAVERVGEQTKAILDEARESAERIIGTARAEADEILGKAKAEAAEAVVDASTEADRLRAEGEQLMDRTRADAEEIVARAQAEAAEHMRQSEEELAALHESAQARMRDLQADTAGVWNERTELLADIEELSTRLKEAAGAAAARVSREEPAEPEVPDEPPTQELDETLVDEGRRQARQLQKSDGPRSAKT